MALVMKSEMVSTHLKKKMAVTGGETKSITVDGVKHLDIVTYPPQGEFEDGAILALVHKPFIDFAVQCGEAGAMTAEKISEKYGDQIPPEMVETLVADFGRAYGNYVIIPNGMTLLITAAPVNSVFDIMIKEETTASQA